MTLSAEQLTAIEGVWAAATPGPWEWNDPDDREDGALASQGGTLELCQPGHHDAWAAQLPQPMRATDPKAILVGGHDGWIYLRRADELAIAAAPRHIAMLIAEVRRLQLAASLIGLTERPTLTTEAVRQFAAVIDLHASDSVTAASANVQRLLEVLRTAETG